MSQLFGVERRITLRLLAYWEKMRRERLMPLESDISPADLHDVWGHCFLVRIGDFATADYHYTYIGEAIVDAYRSGLPDDAGEKTIMPGAGCLIENYRAVAESGKPLVKEGEFRNFSNELVKYRQCVLPLGADGRVQAVFGGMRFKIFSA